MGLQAPSCVVGFRILGRKVYGLRGVGAVWKVLLGAAMPRATCKQAAVGSPRSGSQNPAKARAEVGDGSSFVPRRCEKVA